MFPSSLLALPSLSPPLILPPLPTRSSKASLFRSTTIGIFIAKAFHYHESFKTIQLRFFLQDRLKSSATTKPLKIWSGSMTAVVSLIRRRCAKICRLILVFVLRSVD